MIHSRANLSDGATGAGAMPPDDEKQIFGDEPELLECAQDLDARESSPVGPQLVLARYD
ncbi:MAG: hypothetical protein OXN84_00300 [Albidovulum sp.]|nr:hypothetical protein [Albidovulum sp.]